MQRLDSYLSIKKALQVSLRGFFIFSAENRFTQSLQPCLPHQLPQ